MNRQLLQQEPVAEVYRFRLGGRARSIGVDDVRKLKGVALPPPGTKLYAAPVATEPRRVRKVGGSFQHTGTVVAEFKTLAGEPRIVLEFDDPVAGMLHVYRPDQVEDITGGGNG